MYIRFCVKRFELIMLRTLRCSTRAMYYYYYGSLFSQHPVLLLLPPNFPPFHAPSQFIDTPEKSRLLLLSVRLCVCFLSLSSGQRLGDWFHWSVAVCGEVAWGGGWGGAAGAEGAGGGGLAGKKEFGFSVGLGVVLVFCLLACFFGLILVVVVVVLLLLFFGGGGGGGGGERWEGFIFLRRVKQFFLKSFLPPLQVSHTYANLTGSCLSSLACASSRFEESAHVPPP